MAVNGSAVLLKFNTGTVGVPVWTLIPCQVTEDYKLSVATIDTSCKDSPDDTNIPGKRSRTMSVETIPGAYPQFKAVAATVEEKLRFAAETGIQAMVQIFVAAVAVEQLTATITSVDLAAPREDKVTLKVDLAISGVITPLP